MSNLWEKMIHLFGHKFSATYGESAIVNNELSGAAKTWARGLQGVTNKQLVVGFQQCIHKGEAWPPTLPEFVALCKGKGVNGFNLDYVPECYRNTKK